ncbi:SCO family protein [Erythrobacter sp. JK5]|uniref:SCO family protein n=1 Tax=Erythrobacter sp. JK5 TaxID=2829500 RepID=UPI001BAA3D90|nr:SCO family protein [Erythrobacter sp. JK5]QUL36737.1 SCO family protein [Erythrobacter sp. JK5]
MNHNAKPSSNPLRALAALAIGAALTLSACSGPVDAGPGEPPLAGADIGGEFALSGPGGETVRWSDFDGRYRIVYFGYAYCPDICPTDVQRMTQGLNIASEADPDLAPKVQPIFITIDPERDTREVVDEFTGAFSERLIGLTGTPDQVKAAADTFRVYYEKGESTPDGSYLMNHSNIVYLFGPSGEPLATLPVDQGADAVAAEIAKWVS